MWRRLFGQSLLVAKCRLELTRRGALQSGFTSTRGRVLGRQARDAV
jgi:hypothetical protein